MRRGKQQDLLRILIVEARWHDAKDLARKLYGPDTYRAEALGMIAQLVERLRAKGYPIENRYGGYYRLAGFIRLDKGS